MLKFKSSKIVSIVGLVINIMLMLIIEFLPYITKNNYVIAVVSSLLIITTLNVFNLLDYEGHFCRRNLPINIIGFILIVAFYLFVVLNTRAFTIYIDICTVLFILLALFLSVKSLWVLD